jgi:hypothetical protein
MRCYEVPPLGLICKWYHGKTQHRKMLMENAKVYLCHPCHQIMKRALCKTVAKHCPRLSSHRSLTMLTCLSPARRLDQVSIASRASASVVLRRVFLRQSHCHHPTMTSLASLRSVEISPVVSFLPKRWWKWTFREIVGEAICWCQTQWWRA